MEVDRHQRDADQADMKPPLSHIELSGGVVSFLPASPQNRKVVSGDVFTDAGFHCPYNSSLIQGGKKKSIFTFVLGTSLKIAQTKLILVNRLKVSDLAELLI